LTGGPPAAFQIGRADFGTLQQLSAGSAQRDQAVDHDVAAVGELERFGLLQHVACDDQPLHLRSALADLA